MAKVPDIRLRALNKKAINPQGKYVLYWMTAARRTAFNFGLQRALERARELDRPLLILEALRVGYPWASKRLHSFILEGMADNARSLKNSPVRYYPYVEQKPGQGKGLLASLAESACLVVSDEFPCFFLPRMQNAAARQIKVFMESVDSCGLLPLRAGEKAFATAYAFRRFLQKTLPDHLGEFPMTDPLKKETLRPAPRLPKEITRRWPKATAKMLAAGPDFLAGLPLEHQVKPVSIKGGELAARQVWREFLSKRLSRYTEDRNHPERPATSGLSPYLHFGHISAQQIFLELARQEKWAPHLLSNTTRGQREGWWGMGPSAEAFLDQLITWRELAYGYCLYQPEYDQYESLPDWARHTLEQHARDPRNHLYSLEEFDRAQTHDHIWNAAQTQLRRTGLMHNYLRMLWGKKILEWTRNPKEALFVMIELNNRYALDGRDPNSYSGIFWCLGRFDRAWGPQRPVFGKVRYMSSENTARKIKLKGYLAKYGR